MRFRQRLAALAAALLVATPANATWSVVLVNSETREVLIASATCLADFDLQVGLPVVRVGEGAAAAQSFVDTSGANRLLIWEQMAAGIGPKKIISALADSDPAHQTRQYAIADRDQAPGGFTGQAAGPAKLQVTGIDGAWRYAIAGNVLTGQQVILDAEAALLATDGDGGQKVLAAMEAARALGGDGRCSCALFNPTNCGVPPSGGFEKTAHVGFLIIARLGDADGVCNASVGCANGDYFLDLNVVGSIPDPDPVLTLESQYAVWRASRAGRPDHYASQVLPGAERLVADGQCATEVVVELVDIEGVPLATGGASVVVQRVDTDGQSSVAGAVTDRGVGTYAFDLTATALAGTDRYEITVDDGGETVLLWPPLEITVDPLAPLHAGLTGVSALAGGSVPLTLNTASAGEAYFVLASLAGTEPGIPLGSGVLPLEPDALLEVSLNEANGSVFQGTLGTLDGEGRATAAIVLPPGLATSAVGARVDLAAVLGGAVPSATNAVGFELLP